MGLSQELQGASVLTLKLASNERIVLSVDDHILAVIRPFWRPRIDQRGRDRPEWSINIHAPSAIRIYREEVSSEPTVA